MGVRLSGNLRIVYPIASASMSSRASMLSYRYPDDGARVNPWPALILCVPVLVWLTLSVVAMADATPSRSAMHDVLCLWVWLPFFSLSTLKRYRYRPRSWDVVVCLTLNGIGALFTATPLGILWIWALAARLGS
jgi:hypothetical protein